jgi:hypothetical protein
MSRSEMALLPHDLPTASQVLTIDLKITIAEANIFNLLAADDFQAAAGSSLPAAWLCCKCWILANRG